MDYRKLRINARRLKRTLEEMAKIGATPGGGVHRLALSPEDRQTRRRFVSWLRELHLEVIIDEMGNIFGKRTGKSPRLPAVMAGSHMDSQPYGGRFDGMYGVLGALEALRTLHENKIETERPVIIVNWTNEEGSRFPPAMMGSGVWAGKLKKAWAFARADARGKTFGEELKKIGFQGRVPAKKWPLQCYFELHIEQGPILEKKRKTIGVPKGIVGLRWGDIYVSGTSNQVGPTPMRGRNDALCAAAEMIVRVKQLPASMGGNMVATVGEIQNFPNSRNIIPGKTRFTVDLRSWDDVLTRRAWERLERDFRKIAAARGCTLKCEEIWNVPHTVFSEQLAEMIRETSACLGYSRLSMVSGAGHDASYISQVAPTAMIFVPSIGGRSHVEVENTKWEDCAAGANVLFHCLLAEALRK